MSPTPAPYLALLVVGLLLAGSCATPARSAPAALDPANPDAEESPSQLALTPLVAPGPDAPASGEGSAHSGHEVPAKKTASPHTGHDMAGMKEPESTTDDALAHAGHDMAGMDKPGSDEDKTSPHAGHDVGGMTKPEATKNKPSPHAGHDMGGMTKPEANENKPSPHAGHEVSGMKEAADRGQATDAEEHLKGVVSKKSGRSIWVTFEDSSTVEVVTGPQTQFERGGVKADLLGVKAGERIVVYAAKKDGKWLARVVKLSTATATSFDGGSAARNEVKPPEAARQYTCPMHPEVRSPTPGNCPKCGMKLVPVDAR